MADSTHEEREGSEENSHHDQMFQTVGSQVEVLKSDEKGEDKIGDVDAGSKIVDEIESLCMNCEKNVRYNSSFRVHALLKIGFC